MAQLVAAQQGFAAANDAYQSKIAQDAFAQGSITHKVMYAVILGGIGYGAGSLAFGQGLAGTLKDSSRAVVESAPIFGAFIKKFNDVLDPQKPKTFLEKYGAAIGGVSGIVVGMMIG